MQKDQEGRLLRRGDREAGPAGDRGDRRDRAGGGAARFPWPKSMRWGEQSAKPGALNWVRPLHSIVATFGPETEEPEVVRVRRRRHRGRRHDATAIASWRRRRSRCAGFDDYVAKLEKAKVVLDPARRKEIILADAKNLAFAQGFELVEDEGLLAEVAGPGRMAGGADGLVRRGVPVDPRRGDPRHHPQQPEMLRAARSEDRQARQQVHPRRQHRGERRRQGDRRRQRARDPRAAVGCEVLLRDRSEDAAGRPAAEVRAHRVPREARHAGRAHRAHRAAGGRARAARRRRCREGRDARRSCARPIC